MVKINSLAAHIENAANQYAINNSLNIRFKARTYASFLDKIVETSGGVDREYIPIYLDVPSGAFDAVPNISKVNQTYEINFFFPIEYKETMLALLEYLPSVYVAKVLSIGSEKAVTNLSVPVFGEVQPATMERFSQFIKDTYGNSIVVKRTDYWLNYKLTIFLGSAKANDGSAMLWGNDISYELNIATTIEVPQCTQFTIRWTNYPGQGTHPLHAIISLVGDNYKYTDLEGNTYYLYAYNGEYLIVGDVIYSDSLHTQEVGIVTEINQVNKELTSPVDIDMSEPALFVSASSSQNNSPIGQQLIDQDDFVKNVINTKTYSHSLMVYVRNNPFWTMFVMLYNRYYETLLENMTIVKTYNLNNQSFTYEQKIISIDENIALGDLLSYTFSFADAAIV